MCTKVFIFKLGRENTDFFCLTAGLKGPGGTAPVITPTSTGCTSSKAGLTVAVSMILYLNLVFRAVFRAVPGVRADIAVIVTNCTSSKDR